MELGSTIPITRISDTKLYCTEKVNLIKDGRKLICGKNDVIEITENTVLQAGTHSKNFRKNQQVRAYHFLGHPVPLILYARCRVFPQWRNIG